MVRTASTMLSLETTLPPFDLPNIDGKTVSSRDYSGKPLLVMFISNHCPYVKHLQAGIVEFAKDYQAKGLNIVAISSNDVVAYPADGPELMKAEAKTAGFTFPYLYDETQDVAKAFNAACTPDFFLFDADHQLEYRGQFDASRPGNDVAVTGSDLRAAADAVLANKAVTVDQRPSIGCNIKWKQGQEPSYFTGVRAEG